MAAVLLCLCLPAAPKQRNWQDAKVVKVEQSEIEVESQLYRSSAPSGQVGVPLDTGTRKRTVKVWTYRFKTADKVYAGTAEKKPLEGVREGDTVKVASQRGFLYVLPADGKERRLSTFKSE